MKSKHFSFNPMFGSLEFICRNAEVDGWMLSHVVPVHTYESVAVFVKQDSPEEIDEESEVVFEDPENGSGSYL